MPTQTILITMGTACK